MHAHVAEIGAEAGFHQRTRGHIKRLPARTEHPFHNWWRVWFRSVCIDRPPLAHLRAGHVQPRRDLLCLALVRITATPD
jgi:hypothetical protein